MTKRHDSAQPTEAELERSAADFLALDGWRALKLDPVSQIPRQGIRRKGMADCLFLRFQRGHRPSEDRGVGQEAIRKGE